MILRQLVCDLLDFLEGVLHEEIVERNEEVLRKRSSFPWSISTVFLKLDQLPVLPAESEFCSPSKDERNTPHPSDERPQDKPFPTDRLAQQDCH